MHPRLVGARLGKDQDREAVDVLREHAVEQIHLDMALDEQLMRATPGRGALLPGARLAQCEAEGQLRVGHRKQHHGMAHALCARKHLLAVGHKAECLGKGVVNRGLKRAIDVHLVARAGDNAIADHRRELGRQLRRGLERHVTPALIEADRHHLGVEDVVAGDAGGIALPQVIARARLRLPDANLAQLLHRQRDLGGAYIVHADDECRIRAGNQVADLLEIANQGTHRQAGP